MSEMRGLMFPTGKPGKYDLAIEAENFAWI